MQHSSHVLLVSSSAQCECSPMLQDRGLLCNISGATLLVQRTMSMWISTHHNGSDIILHDHCLLNYCKPTQLWLHLDHPDKQCAHGRSGILCGRCNSNLSLTIGTSLYKYLPYSSHTICTSWTNASAATDHL